MNVHRHYHKRLALAFDDVFECKNYAEHYLKNHKGKLGSKERIIHDALLTALVVSYGRIFSKSYADNNQYNSDTSKKFKAFVQKKLSKLLAKEEKLHQYLMKQRDTIFAHSDAKAYDLVPYKIFDSIGYIGNNTFYGYTNDIVETIMHILNYFNEEILNEQESLITQYPHAFEDIN